MKKETMKLVATDTYRYKGYYIYKHINTLREVSWDIQGIKRCFTLKEARKYIDDLTQ